MGSGRPGNGGKRRFSVPKALWSLWERPEVGVMVPPQYLRVLRGPGGWGLAPVSPWPGGPVPLSCPAGHRGAPRPQRGHGDRSSSRGSAGGWDIPMELGLSLQSSEHPHGAVTTPQGCGCPHGTTMSPQSRDCPQGPACGCPPCPLPSPQGCDCSHRSRAIPRNPGPSTWIHDHPY